MTLDTLQKLRFITPPVIILVYVFILGQITGLWKTDVPSVGAVYTCLLEN